MPKIPRLIKKTPSSDRPEIGAPTNMRQIYHGNVDTSLRGAPSLILGQIPQVGIDVETLATAPAIPPTVRSSAQPILDAQKRSAAALPDRALPPADGAHPDYYVPDPDGPPDYPLDTPPPGGQLLPGFQEYMDNIRKSNLEQSRKFAPRIPTHGASLTPSTSTSSTRAADLTSRPKPPLPPRQQSLTSSMPTAAGPGEARDAGRVRAQSLAVDRRERSTFGVVEDMMIP